MRYVKIFFWVLGILVLILGGFVFKTFRDAGELKEIEPLSSGTCQAISGVQSSEDITIHPKTGMAFISSDDRRPLFRGGHGKQGAIYGFDLKADHPDLVNLTSDFDKDFHPHGIGLFLGEDGRASLFVVNHRKEGHFVEIFDLTAGRLVHRKSVRGALMHSPNDVLPDGPESFYVTNDHGYDTKTRRTLEEYLQLARAYVLYYDGNQFRVLVKGLAYANGINMSEDGKTVYVAATVGKKIYVYNRDPLSKNLTVRRTIGVDTGVDNIELDESGNLWIGAHPKLLTFVGYSKDPEKKSPSQVLKVMIRDDQTYQMEEIYLNDGNPLSGSSVAAVFGDKMLVGSVFDPRFLLCQRP
jgi:arylesterase/paraoxonase